MKPSRSERRGLSWSPLLSAGAMGCCVGYLVASLIMGHRCPWYEPIGVVLDDSPKSKTQFATRSATELQKNNDEKQQQQQQGWNKVHVYYGKPDHLEILTPMAQAKQDEHVAAMLSHKKEDSLWIWRPTMRPIFPTRMHWNEITNGTGVRNIHCTPPTVWMFDRSVIACCCFGFEYQNSLH